MSECHFCKVDETRVVERSLYSVVIRDAFPVTHQHTLVIPNRHVASFFELTTEEVADVMKLLSTQQRSIRELDKTVTGFNIGINVGEDAGQTIFHCHIHLIPRRRGDVESPRGGVRGVIPGKASY